MTSRILYYGLILPLSILPMWMLYAVSNFIFYILYFIVGYRKKVVGDNLKRSFPAKSGKELETLRRKFYRHFCDIIVESLKTFTISEKLANKKMVHHNTDLFQQLHDKQKNIAIVGGHYNNWELYATTIDQQLKHKAIALFTPLSNAYFNGKMKTTRSKFGLQMLSILDIKKELDLTGDNYSAIIFGADQSPKNPNRAYWLTFLGQDTGVQFGCEKLASDYNMAVVYGGISKTKRGHYEVNYELICEDASQTAYGFVTEQHTKLLERDIIASPAYWLWTHRRWKREKPANHINQKPKKEA
ncbi:MAG: KDO2-lipid IV(A) lauroyltransferase [Flavobacteriales bacterium]|jgi:KDO2-lipid IV(A) lauroyltransferase